jgi:hypothetical protein
VVCVCWGDAWGSFFFFFFFLSLSLSISFFSLCVCVVQICDVCRANVWCVCECGVFVL